MRQVVMNLITNASEALESTEGRVVVGTSVGEFSCEQLQLRHPNTPLEPGEYIRVWVSDTGTGMPPATLARIFDPFFTTKPKGRGLGLAAVQGIVRSHGGALAVESTPGEGTTFSMLLPRVALPGEAARRSAERGAVTGGARILVVDDELAVRQVLVGILEHAGYEVVEACDGQEAVDIFREQSDTIDCVLLDLSMPKLDGEEAFAQMREIRGDARVILSSGFTEQEIINRFQGAGLAGVVQKPAQIQVVLEKIAGALA
jgi:two-component system cell cycle sensor histidine kinase/response regulator CckA